MSAEDDLDRLVRRLRSLSARGWAQEGRAQGSRADVVRRLLVDLAALAAPGRTVPDLPEHALADAVAVLGADALDSPDVREGAGELIAGALDATR